MNKHYSSPSIQHLFHLNFRIGCVMAKTIADSKLAWVVCLGTFWTLTFIHGVVRSSGVFYASMVETWGNLYTREEVSWPFNLCLALNGIGVFLTGISTVTFIIRRGAPIAVLLFFGGIALSSFTNNIPLLILLIGLIGGLSQGYLMATCYILICHYFDNYRTVATGIAISGSPVGGILFPYLYNYLIQEYGLSSSYLLGAAISSHALIGAMFCRLISMIEKEGNHSRQQVSFKKEENSLVEERTSGDPEQINYSRNLEKAQARRQKDINRVSKLQANQMSKIIQFIKHKFAVLKHPMFYIYALSFPVVNISTWSWIIILVDFAKDRDVTQANASYLLSILSVADLCGRVFYGWFIDFGCVKKKTALIVLFFCMSLNCFLMILFNSFVALCVSTAFFGIFIGSFATNRAAIPAIYFGIEGMRSAMGLAGLIITGISLLRPTLIGLIRDKNESYDGIFLTLGALLCMGGILWLFEYFVMRFYNRNVPVKQQGDI